MFSGVCFTFTVFCAIILPNNMLKYKCEVLDMGKTPGLKSFKTGAIYGIILFTATLVFFAFLFFNCISLYSEFDIDYSDLICEELTYEKHEVIRTSKYRRIEIYFTEYDAPLEIDTISQRKLDMVTLEKITEKEKLKVYYCKSSNKNYEFEICEMSSSSAMLLSLSDYIEVNQNNQVIGMIVCPVFILCSLFLIFVFARILKHSHDRSELGKVKIRYETQGNIICVHNAINVCSLVINGKIADQFWGAVAGKFSLNGKLTVEGKTISVEARMGLFYMRLYCGGKLAAKKFMAFG